MEGGEHGGSGRTVCVTGASGFIASWLVMRLLQLGYHVRATVRDPDNKSKVSYLLDLPKAGTHLTLWKADLLEEGSFDDAIQGCDGVFHVAAYVPVLPVNDPENELIKPTVNGVLNIMRSCSKAKTVKRLICTSTTGAVTVQPPPEPDQYDESFWTDVDFCKEKKILGWPYFVAKTMAEKAAWKFAEENGIDLVAIHPSMVIGPFITPLKPVSIDITLALITTVEKSRDYVDSMLRIGIELSSQVQLSFSSLFHNIKLRTFHHISIATVFKLQSHPHRSILHVDIAVRNSITSRSRRRLKLLSTRSSSSTLPLLLNRKSRSVVASAQRSRNEALYPLLSRGWAVHLDDVCSAHIYLLENPQAKGRYLCSSHCFTIFELSKSLSQKYPDCNIPTKFEGIDESLKSIPASSKKLLHLGFKFKYNPDEYNAGDLCSEAIEFCREKGWLTL
ncbi:unnamed protein product [Camellia sinensis]